MLKDTKVYFDQLFKDDWCDTPVHYAGEEFDAGDIHSWINISTEPVRNRNSSLSGGDEYHFTFYVACWGETEVDVMTLGDNVSEFINTNADDKYMSDGYEIIDRGWQDSNHVFMVISFQFKVYGGECSS